MWKKTVESKDLIVFEKILKKFKLKIEARKNGDIWEVFKTRINENSSELISEHYLESKKEVLKLINRLMKDKKTAPSKKKALITLRRVYKEDFLEKWFFNINNEPINNFIIIKYDTKIMADLILHEKYSFIEKDILNKIESYLGLRELGELITYEKYYFKKHSTESSKKINPEFIEVDFLDEDYY